MTQDLSEREFQKFQDFIYSTCGIRVPDKKRMLLSNRIRKRLKAGGIADFKEYYTYLTSTDGQAELQRFLDAVTTNETYFFRTEKHFEWFQSDFISELIQSARRGDRPRQMRVWSAACSSGEEPYSLSICLAQNQLRLKDWQLEIVGTDISDEALQLARKGRYSQKAVKALTDSQRKRYFRADTDDHWCIRPVVSDLVTLHTHNLITPMRALPFDCIFIRNVLIYFDRESKQIVIDNLINSLADGGYLVVGPSEGIYDMLGMLKRHSPFLYQKCS